MAAEILSGRDVAAVLKDQVAERVARLAKVGTTVGLATVLVSEDPASEIYVRNKHRAAEAVGMKSNDYKSPATVAQSKVEVLIDRLNRDDRMLPLPRGRRKRRLRSWATPDLGLPDRGLWKWWQPARACCRPSVAGTSTRVTRVLGLRPSSRMGISPTISWSGGKGPLISVLSAPSPAAPVHLRSVSIRPRWHWTGSANLPTVSIA